VDWKLCDVAVHSNLGGVGPDGGNAEIRFSNVAMTSGGSVDLVVTNSTMYYGKNLERNGESDCFGQINVKAGSSVKLSFRFVQTGTSESVKLPRSFFTVYDIDESKKGMQEAVTFNTAVSGYWLMATSELVTTTNDEGLTFTSTVAGVNGDNPTSPENLSLEQRDRAVTVQFDGVDEYVITFSAIGEGNGGRNFMFAGHSSLTTDASQ
jgi:hypothetical protein